MLLPANKGPLSQAESLLVVSLCPSCLCPEKTSISTSTPSQKPREVIGGAKPPLGPDLLPESSELVKHEEQERDSRNEQADEQMEELIVRPRYSQIARISFGRYYR